MMILIQIILIPLAILTMVLLINAENIVNRIAKGENIMKLPDKVYDVLKWILTVAVAPTIALIAGLGQLYDFDTYKIIQVISLISTFLGAIFGISVYQYNKEINNADN